MIQLDSYCSGCNYRNERGLQGTMFTHWHGSGSQTVALTRETVATKTKIGSIAMNMQGDHPRTSGTGISKEFSGVYDPTNYVKERIGRG